MKLIRQVEQIDETLAGCALTIGNFDGVHRGHEKIVSRLKDWAKRLNGPSVVLTFDPHPVRLLRPELAPPPLTWTERKAQLLGDLEVDCMIAWPTDRALLGLSYREFFQRVIVEKLHAAAVIEGPNFFFGRNREGDIQRLRELCEDGSIACEIVEPGLAGEDLISSTRIRDCVRQGQVKQARQMLTKPYRIRGLVVHGASRGTSIGFPTANLDAIDTLVPQVGVYSGIAEVAEQKISAAIHIGPSPTFGVERPTVEVHLIDFSDSIYGQVITVDFLERLRNIEDFQSPADLQDQLARDVASARSIGERFLNNTQSSITEAKEHEH